MKKIIVTVLVVLLLCPTAVLSARPTDPPHWNYAPLPEETFDDFIPTEYAISTDDLYTAYKEDAAQFERDYMDEEITVYGKIYSIKNGKYCNYIVALMIKGSPQLTFCYFPSDQFEELEPLKSGQRVQITGTVVETGLGISISYCSIG